MNPTDRLISTYESILKNQQAFNVKLDELVWMLWVGIGLGVVIVVMLAVDVAVTLIQRADFKRHDAKLDEISKQYQEVHDLMVIAKGWASLAFIHSEKAKRVETDTLTAVQEVPVRTVQRVEQVLEKKLKEDSDPLKKGLPPPSTP